MFKIRNLVIISAVLLALSFSVFGVNNLIKVANDISLEEIKDCETVYWNETENVYGNCTSHYNVTTCNDPPLNKSCVVDEMSSVYECILDTKILAKSKEVCRDRSMELLVEKSLENKRYNLSYGDWGNCSYLPGENSVMIVCDSRLDGNGDGTCQPGESCILFDVSKHGVMRLFRNSRADFVEDDKTFYQEKLEMMEVGE